jgi:hypothetical protein
MLYIGDGDGGGGGDQHGAHGNGQNPGVLLGKLLRIDVTTRSNGLPYGIPKDNPFAGQSGWRPEIWALGLRNPWRFSFDRATGDLYIGDVGQDAREEVDFQPRASGGGENYGWKIMEGTLCGVGGSSGCPSGIPACNSAVFKAPLYEYGHQGSNCTGTVIGGYVYRGAVFPQLAGVYLYGDYCFGWLFGNGQMLTPNVPQLTSFGEDSSGEIYLGTETGRLLRIVPPALLTTTPTPTAARTPPALPPRPRATPRVVTFPN